MPVNVLVVLGFSTRLLLRQKESPLPRYRTVKSTRAILPEDRFLGDQNYRDVAKIQMLAFTFLAIWQ